MSDNTIISLSSNVFDLSAVPVTVVEPLTSVTAPTLSEQIQFTVATVLTALDQMKHQFDAMLSATPLHPYEKLKAQYLDPNEKCEMLCDLQVPEDFCLDTINCCITAISENIYNNSNLQVQMLTAVESEEDYQKLDTEAMCNAFAELSGNTFVVNKQKMANHLKFLELTRNLTVEQIDADPVGVAKKVMAQYVKLYQ